LAKHLLWRIASSPTPQNWGKKNCSFDNTIVVHERIMQKYEKELCFGKELILFIAHETPIFNVFLYGVIFMTNYLLLFRVNVLGEIKIDI